MGIDLNAVRQENTRLESQGQNNFLDNFVPMPEGEGTIVLRLLPLQGSKLPWVTTRTHKLNNKNFHCPMTLVNGKWQGNCPICNYYRYLWKESEHVGEEEAKSLQTEARSIKPVERYYWNAIIRFLKNKAGEGEHNVGPKIFSCGKQLQAKITRAMCGAPEVDEPELGDVTDTSNGRDLKVIKRMVKSGKEEYPNYTESKFLNESVAGTEEEIATWMETLHNLMSLRAIKPFEELKRELDIHRGIIKDPELAFDTEEMTAEEEVAPAPKAAAKPAQTRTKPIINNTPVTPPSVEDFDEALPDESFFDKLRSL